MDSGVHMVKRPAGKTDKIGQNMIADQASMQSGHHTVCPHAQQIRTGK
jgi:hypothetical protein